jgi:cytochrome c peroxidase
MVRNRRDERTLGHWLAIATAGLLLAFPGPLARADEARPLSPLEALGEEIFSDPSLSEPAGLSCSSCHEPSRAFTGNAGSEIAAVSKGSRPGAIGRRNAPSIMYMAFSPPFSLVAETGETGETEYTPTGGLFWDGRADSFSEQALGPLFNPIEMNNRDAASLATKLKSAAYADAFRQQFGADALDDPDRAVANLATAIAAFESSGRLQPFSSRFDSVLRGTAEFTAAERRGLELFKDPQKGNCIACHTGSETSRDPRDWLFTDFTYDALGVPRNAAIPANSDRGHFDAGLCERPGIEQMLPKEVTRESLCGAFKVPTLRNVGVTAPYFHNGKMSSLRDVVKFYVSRDTDPAAWYPRDASGKLEMLDDLPAALHGNVNTEEAPYDRKQGEQPRLSDSEIDDLVAFLNTLTDAGMK